MGYFVYNVYLELGGKMELEDIVCPSCGEQKVQSFLRTMGLYRCDPLEGCGYQFTPERLRKSICEERSQTLELPFDPPLFEEEAVPR